MMQYLYGILVLRYNFLRERISNITFRVVIHMYLKNISFDFMVGWWQITPLIYGL